MPVVVVRRWRSFAFMLYHIADVLVVLVLVAGLLERE